MTSRIRFLDFSSVVKENTEFILIGIPLDGEMTQTRGKCITAPDEIRKISLDLSLTSENGTDLNSIHLVDVGDIEGGSSDELITNISSLLDSAPDAIPFFIGGSHYISNYAVRSLIQKRHQQDLHYISLDAHLDCYDEWNGDKNTHCTVTRRIFESLGSKSENTYVIGARDIDLPELEWANEVNFQFFRMDDISEGCQLFSDKIGKPPLYLSIDIDIFDPSVAPATGYPIPGGISYRDYLRILSCIIDHFTIVGVDFVEFSPELDLPNRMTAFLVAKLIIETLVKIKNKNKKN